MHSEEEFALQLAIEEAVKKWEDSSPSERRLVSTGSQRKQVIRSTVRKLMYGVRPGKKMPKGIWK